MRINCEMWMAEILVHRAANLLTLANSGDTNSNEVRILSTMTAGYSLLWICVNPGRRFL